MRIGSFALVFILAFSAGALHGCGGGSAKPTPKCVLASDCTGDLVCALGFCVAQCAQSKDCPSGQLCVKADTGNACRAPEIAKGCAQNSDCTDHCQKSDDAGTSVCPIVCGRDFSCRTQCAADVDCPGGGRPGGQKCTVSGACVDPVLEAAIYDPKTNEFKASATTGLAGTGGGKAGTSGSAGQDGGAGTTGEAGTGAEAGTGGGAGAGAGTGGGAGTTGAAGKDGGAGTTGAAGSNADAGNPEVAVTPDGVMVMPTASLRQGQGIGITITITRAAGGLSNPSVVDFGGVKATVVTDMSTDTSLVLRVTVPHATALGKKTLVVSTKSGMITATDVVTITAITAGPAGMDTNVGSEGSPFKSLKQALGVADVGDTIHLLDGKYTIAASGETWGYPLPDDITIVGDSTANTIIDGVGAANSPDGFDVSKKLTLKTLTVQHFRYGIDLAKAASEFVMQDVVVGGNSSYGIYVEQAAMGSSVTITGKASLIDQPGQTAIYIYNVPMTTLNITDATIQGGYQVIQYSYNVSGAKVNITGATIKQLSTSYSAFVMQPSSHTVGTTTTIMNTTFVGNVYNSDNKGSMTITGGTITQKNGNGVDFDGMSLVMNGTTITMVNQNNVALQSAGMGTVVSLKNVTIDGGSYNIQQQGAGSAFKLRGTTLKNAYYDGYYLQAGNLDMGTATEEGGNTITVPAYAGGYCLYIYRGTGAAAGDPVTCSGSSIGAAGNVPAAQTVDASGGPITKATQLWYVNTGNKLIFY
jgi:hypothetical protein